MFRIALTRCRFSLSRSPFYNFANVFKYTKEHEWVNYDKTTKEGTIGITHYAQQQLGDIVHISLPEKGAAVKKGDAVGAIESVKMVADLFCPVNGVVTKVNDTVLKDPALVNQNAEKEWLNSIKLESEKDLDDLLTKEQYDEFVKTLANH